jgi:hypothetical protein
MPEHRVAAEWGEELVKAHASAAAGGDDEGANHEKKGRRQKAEGRRRNETECSLLPHSAFCILPSAFFLY